MERLLRWPEPIYWHLGNIFESQFFIRNISPISSALNLGRSWHIHSFFGSIRMFFPLRNSSEVKRGSGIYTSEVLVCVCSPVFKTVILFHARYAFFETP